MHKFRAPIIQYEELIPQNFIDKLIGKKQLKRLRIKRAEPQSINCRCYMDYNFIVK